MFERVSFFGGAPCAHVVISYMWSFCFYSFYFIFAVLCENFFFFPQAVIVLHVFLSDQFGFGPVSNLMQK